MEFETKRLGKAVDAVAPDGSEIRLLAQTARGSVVHCTLPVGGASKAVRHRSVEEIWYFLSGVGEVWRATDDAEEVTEVTVGVSLAIPTGARFQFRNTGGEPLCFVIATMPPWPGDDEAVRAPDHWPAGD